MMNSSGGSGSTVLDMDWGRSPARRSYTVSNGAKITVQPRPLAVAVAVTILALLFLTYVAVYHGRGGGGSRSKSSFHHDHMEHTGPGGSGGGGGKPYNDQYPLTRPEIVSHGVFR